MRKLGGLFKDGLCTGAMIGKLLWQLMLKVSEGDLSLQLQWFFKFVPVSGSRELEGKAAKRGVGFGDAQWNIPAGARATGGCWDKAELYLAKTYRWPGASGFSDEYEAKASQREHTGRSGGWYMGLWWQNRWHCDRLHPIWLVVYWSLFCKWCRRSKWSVG